jgi:protein gp37
MGVEQYRNGFKLALAPHTLTLPYSWKQPRTVFVNSMSDLFHEDVPLEYIKKVFKVMNETPRHTYQVLTKRSERLEQIAEELDWAPNIWMGVSVENESVVDRVTALKKTPAHIKFLSVEPLLGPLPTLDLTGGIDWVIVGGESGHGARPLKKEWVMDVRKKCKEASVHFFFKQWGDARFNANQDDPTISAKHPQHAKGGCQLNGRVYRGMPERVGV